MEGVAAGRRRGTGRGGGRDRGKPEVSRVVEDRVRPVGIKRVDRPI